MCLPDETVRPEFFRSIASPVSHWTASQYCHYHSCERNEAGSMARRTLLFGFSLLVFAALVVGAPSIALGQSSASAASPQKPAPTATSPADDTDAQVVTAPEHPQ